MKSSFNPFASADILQNIFTRLPKSDLKNANVVCKKWHEVLSTLTTKEKLSSEFHVAEKTVTSLKSPDLVCKRLDKIFKRGKVSFLNEHSLYRLYCVGGSIDNDFIHLLDNDENWFNRYFSNRDAFFLEFNFMHACMIGNLDLVTFLIEKKGCKPRGEHMNAATASGELDLVKFLLETKKCKVITEAAQNIFYESVLSGNVDVLKYVHAKFNRCPIKKDFSTGISSGSFEMVKFLYETYHFTIENTDNFLFTIKNSRNLKIIQYLVEDLGWIPEGRNYNNFYMGVIHNSGATEITNTAYKIGMLEIIKYIEEKFPCEIENLLILEDAIESGSLDAVRHLLSKIHITPENLKNIIVDSQIILLQGIKSGNLDVVKFLVGECGLTPVRQDLLNYAVESHSVAVIRYLIDHHGYKITESTFAKALHKKNLEVVSFIFNHCQNINPHTVNQVCAYADCLPAVYHLITKENYQPDEKMLSSAFYGYRFNANKELIRYFIQYLIDVHHLKPTQKMIDTMSEKGDQEMLAILQNKKQEGTINDESAHIKTCRL